MEETIKKLKDYIEVIKVFDGEDGKYYLIEKTLINFLLVGIDNTTPEKLKPVIRLKLTRLLERYKSKYGEI